MAGDNITFTEQLILIPLIGLLILGALGCGVGYLLTEGELSVLFADFGSKAGIAAILTAMSGHTLLSILKRLFSFEL